MRKKIIAGNWKMNMTSDVARDLVDGIKAKLPNPLNADVVVCPPFTVLKSVADRIAGSAVDLGAQNMHWEKSGAYTGEVSPEMLRDVMCNYVILGHSERRAYFGETDEMVNRKAKAALAMNLKPIICVGETLEEREADKTKQVVETQVRGSLAELGAKGWADAIIAYEPVWAIGTGRTATPEQAQEVHAFIRSIVRDMAGAALADAMRIQYGGSMKPDNAKELLSQPDIDGGLIGGAALKADSFLAIVQAAC
ncbi:MAG: triose-phosphate isomerase [Kiritimatiellae bacterium]|nr:triose-phosphate isomerase [Kiritimatiellia bacterium]